MDDQLDDIEEESKPGAEAKKDARSYREQSEQAKKSVVNEMLNGEVEDPRATDDTPDIEKPGPSIHTTAWDDCIRGVQEKDPKANAYAVCTAQLGEESFKSEHRHKAYIKAIVRKARLDVEEEKREKMGIGEAGPVPNSLLARQDLEGEADESEEDLADGIGDVSKDDRDDEYCRSYR